jgi:Flp pilus assembly secretin CpaC
MIAGIGKRIAAIGCACAVFSAAAMAQQIPQRQPAPSLSRPAPVLPEPAPSRKSPPAAESISPGVIEMTMNKGQFVDVPASTKHIAIGNDAIADVDDKINDELERVFVRAKAIGSTNLFFMGDDGGVIHQLEVNVVFDHQGLRAALAQFLPDEKIDVSIYRESVFLAGKLRSATASAQVVAIARKFVGADADIVNMLTMIGSQQVIMVVSDSWWKFVFGVAPDSDGHSIMRRGQAAARQGLGPAFANHRPCAWRSAPTPSAPRTAWPRFPRWAARIGS